MFFIRNPNEAPSKLRISINYIQNALSEAKMELKESINDITENVSDQGQIFVLNDFND